MDWKELIGYLAPVFIVASMSQSVLKRIRIFMILGCLTFVIYGILVGAWPVVVANAMIGIVTAYYYFRAQNVEHLFQLTPPENLLSHFLTERKKVIEKRFPREFPLGTRFLMVTKDVVPVGLFAYHPLPDGNVEVLLDYVEPAYRDPKTEALIYCENQGYLKEKGYKKAIVRDPTEIAKKEFFSLGFTEEGNDLVKDILS